MQSLGLTVSQCGLLRVQSFLRRPKILGPAQERLNSVFPGSPMEFLCWFVMAYSSTHRTGLGFGVQGLYTHLVHGLIKVLSLYSLELEEPPTSKGGLNKSAKQLWPFIVYRKASNYSSIMMLCPTSPPHTLPGQISPLINVMQV